MSRAGARRVMVACALAAGFAGVQAAVAQADDTAIKMAIVTQDETLAKSPALKVLSKQHITKKQVPKVLKAVKKFEPKLKHAATVVGNTPASSAKGKAGRDDWAKGVRDIAKGYNHLADELGDVEKDNESGAETQLGKAIKAIEAGEKLVVSADQKLGLPKGD